MGSYRKNKKTRFSIGAFQKDLEQSVVKSLFLLVGISCILFAMGMFITRIISNQINASKYLNLLENTYKEVYQQYSEYLYDKKTQELCKNTLLENKADTDLTYSFNKFNAENSVKSDMIIMKQDGRISTTTFDSSDLNLHLINFNEFICENAKAQNRDAIYQSVYFIGGDTSSYVLCCPLYEKEDVIGFVNLYLNSSSWNKLFADYQLDGIITDDTGNVIYSSRLSLIEKINKFKVEPGTHIYYYKNDRYWIVTKKLYPYGVNIYSLVYYPKSFSFVGLGVVIICVLGASLLKLAKKISKETAERKSASINILVNEIKIIRKGNHEHRISLDRISMDTEDEIADVGHEINRMLDNINKLNDKNTELIRLNNAIEIKHLTEQINPHFLYNTLEIIRYLVLMDSKRAEKLIIQLTQILRYSINNSKKDVLLLDDMEFIKNYLDIQSNRFENRFKYSIHIEEACYNSIIPKLLLQPIIENSIKYGFKKKMEIEIRITGYMRDKVLYLEVWDNGAGMEKNEIEELQRSVAQEKATSEHNGLHNIARRLYLQYGTDSGIQLAQNEEQGLTVTLCISQMRGGNYVQSFNR